ncbi:MAG: general secretion pathway protein GspL [Ideonella sp.]|nr:general secretion pathway protein GspL [Ideonella sp.]
MTLLVILLATRPQAADNVDTHAPLGPLQYVLSPDGVSVSGTGRASAAGLPRTETVIAVLPATEVAWHRVMLPKAPAARLRQALAGLLEEQLLDEPDETHLALAPQARAGEACWVAATNRPWLAHQLNALDAAGIMIDRVVPGIAPGDAAQGHFFAVADPAGSSAADELWLSWSDSNGALCLRTSGGLARALLPASNAPTGAPGLPATGTFTATPAAAVAAERWLGGPVPVRSDAEHALANARSVWNLRQFELAGHARGLRAVRGLGRQLLGPSWRPFRLGLAVLALVHVVGLNLWAWTQQRQISQRRDAINAVLSVTHPQVRSILDAPLQMLRETELLRLSAGKAGDDDLETLLGMAAAVWPEGRPPVERIRFELGRLVLPAPGWDPAALQQLRSRLESAGGKLDSNDTELSISRPARRAVP